MPGTKTSVWLGEDLRQRWKASKLSLTEIVSLGLDAAEARKAAGEDRPATVDDLAAAEDRIVRRVREELERIAGR
jgi:hypothetical protein